MFQLDFDLLDLIQSLSDGFYPLMKSLSTIGESRYYFLAIVILMWCVNYREFSRLALVIPFCGALAESLKIAIRMPRPYHFEDNITAISSFGMPSGHALSAVPFWGYLAGFVKKRWFTILSILIILGIGISRVYRGSHFPSQVVVGFILGGAMLAAIHYFPDALSISNIRRRWIRHLLLSCPIVLVALVSLLSGMYYKDGLAMENAVEVATYCGLYYGFALSLEFVEEKKIIFDVRVSFRRQVIKIAVCIVCILLYTWVNKYTGKIVPVNQAASLASLFVFNLLSGLSFSFYIPMFFSRFGLVRLNV
jgi:membrane-associated phospholipid phosphatase